MAGGQYRLGITSFERARRNEEIVTARLRGLSEPRVAAAFGVSDRHVRRVLQEYRESRPALHQVDPAVALADTLDAYQALLDEAVELADEAQHESVRLGALKLRFTLLEARLGLTPGLGLVPSRVDRARMQDEMRGVVRQILAVFDRNGIPEHVQQETVDAVEGRSPAGLEPAVDATGIETPTAAVADR